MNSVLPFNPGDDIPDSDHVVHYLGLTKVQGGVIDGSALVDTQNRGGLSVNWLEYFGNIQKQEQVNAVRQVIQLDLRPLGKLAELNAGQTKSHIAGARPDAPVRFVYAPSPPRGKFGCDPSHCDVRGVPSPDSDIAMLIGDMIAECVLVIHPARLPPDT